MINSMNNTDKIIEVVKQSVMQGNFPHGVLVECDNEQEGTEFARFIANCLVCRGEEKPCMKCPDCRKIENNGHPDIFETDGIKGKSKYFSVDAVREIRSNAFIVPNESDKKIYILKNGQNMNEQAQNALLKILEEPPSYVYFIIVSTSKSAMLETILSRVQVYSILGDEEEIDEKEEQTVKNMISALLSVNELKLLEETAVFQKNNRYARRVLVILSEVFRDALVKKSGFSREVKFSGEVSALCLKLTSKSLLRLVNTCDELIESIDRNCNNNLLLVRMCCELKRAIGK